jgi:mRNA-degrading endonuclease YafQ of YafQ-DinJ toxin-antitoxin module
VPLIIRQSTRFRRDVKRLLHAGADLSKLEVVVLTLVAQQPLENRHRDHSMVDDELQLVRTGSHAELFGR